jgi:hypothetical protein
MVIAVPNAVNLRKRVAVPAGRSNWSSFEHWYGPTVFRGHVREPTTGDLRRIADDLELRDVEVLGRNWLGSASDKAWVRGVTRTADGTLRRFPSLCSTLYLLGRTPGKQA